jgi:hypothetical protein
MYLSSLKKRRAISKGTITRMIKKVNRFLSVDPIGLDQELLLQQSATLAKAADHIMTFTKLLSQSSPHPSWKMMSKLI